MAIIKQTIKSIFHSFGYDVRRLHPAFNSSYQILQLIRKFNIDLVLDVGANIGQSSIALRSVGYQGEIVSFEPLSTAHQELLKAASGDQKWRVHERCAIGDFNGEIEINIAGNSVSSSILPMMDSHSSAAIGSSYINAEKTPIYKLDTIAPNYIKNAQATFIKIDTQGFEWQVLDGATQVLPNVQGLLCELSLVPLYEGQKLYQDIIERLKNSGFDLWAIQPGFTDPRDGRTLQVDAILFRNK